jgi:serine/threonine-protein kinase
MRGDENTLSTAGAKDLAPGTHIGEYVVEQLVGRGGMSTVYRATHPVIGGRVAIKLLSIERLHDPQAVSRFIQEARTANEIRHRNIVDVFAFGRLDTGQTYCVMEYLEGESLSQHLARTRAMTLADAIAVLHPVARALDAAHAKGVVHRDIKPANIFLRRDPEGAALGQVKLLDFGVAKLLATSDLKSEHHTQTGSWIGTPSYMSPEQWNAKDVDERADVYSLGVVAYEMLTGQLPYAGDGFADMLVQQQTQPPRPASELAPAIPPTADAVLARALDKDPAQRFVRASAFVDALADAAGMRTPASASTAIPRTRRRWLWASLAGAGLASAIATVSWWPRSQQPAAPAAAVTSLPVVPVAPPPPAIASSPPAVPAVEAQTAPSHPAPASPPRVRPARRSAAAPASSHDVVPEMPVKL